MKFGPGFLHHLALARRPGTKNQGSIGQGSSHPRLAYSVAATQLGLVGFVRSAVRGPTAGVTAPNRYNRTAGPWTGPPPVIGPRASDHGPLELAL